MESSYSTGLLNQREIVETIILNYEEISLNTFYFVINIIRFTIFNKLFCISLSSLLGRRLSSHLIFKIYSTKIKFT